MKGVQGVSHAGRSGSEICVLERDHYHGSVGLDTLLDECSAVIEPTRARATGPATGKTNDIRSGRQSEEMIYEPMDPNHDRQTRTLVCMGRACDVEVQALELVLSEELFGELVFDDPQQLALEANIS